MKVETPKPIDAATLGDALAEASIPTLLPVLVQLTGDERWLSEPFRVARPIGFDDEPTGGLSEELQQEVRDAAADAILQWSKGAAPKLADPDPAMLARLMSAAMGQRISDEYSPMIAEQIGLRPFAPAKVEDADGFEVAIIGAGISGMALGRALKAAGIPFTIYEKNAEVGGTWWENRYPGARCDIPSNLYSFSFNAKPWSLHFSKRDEIQQYLVDTSKEIGIRDSIRFGNEISAARWDEESQRWLLTVRAGDRTESATARVLISAVGLHSRPAYPDIPGLDAFAGDVLHVAAWPDNYELAGRRVGVIGSAAAAMQFCPFVADTVKQLTIFQRSAQWVVPNRNYFQPVTDKVNWLLLNVPFYWEWNRFRLYWLYTEGAFPALVVDPEWDRSKNSVNSYSEAIRRHYTDYMQRKLADRPDLIERATPNYPPFARRILMDNGWYDTIKRDDVDLVTAGIDHVDATGVVTTDGAHHDLDTIVLCTGYQQQRFLYPMTIEGRGGRSLRDEWKDDDARAYLGITAPGYPNLFICYGPNTNPPGGSFYSLAEAQCRYIVEMITTMINQGLGVVDCRQDVFDDYSRRLDEGNKKMVFAADHAESYYRNSAGRVVTNSPWTVLQYWNWMRHPNLDDFEVEPSADLEAVSG